MESVWHRENSRLCLAETPDPFSDSDPESLWRYMTTDLVLETFPPLFIVSDTLALLQYYQKAAIKKINGIEEAFLHRYRNLFIYQLLQRDPTIHDLHRIILAKGRSDRKFFIPYVVREVSRRIMGIYPFSLWDPALDDSTAAALSRRLVKQTELFLSRFLDYGPLFSQEQMAFFAYIRKEEEIPMIASYTKAVALLDRARPSPVEPTRAGTTNFMTAKDDLSAVMGGISGIRPGGKPDRISGILPSELAMMEPGDGPDLFDIHWIENRLLYFTRDRSLNTALRPKLNFLFLSADSLDYQPQIIPVRFLYFFMALSFNLMDYCATHLNAVGFSFYFMKDGGSDTVRNARELIDIVRQRDFPAMAIGCSTLSETELVDGLDSNRDETDKTGLTFIPRQSRSDETSGLLGSKVGQTDVLIGYAQTGHGINPRFFSDYNSLCIEYGGEKGCDSIRIRYPGSENKKPGKKDPEIKDYILDSADDLRNAACRIRDSLLHWILYHQNGGMHGNHSN